MDKAGTPDGSANNTAAGVGEAEVGDVLNNLSNPVKLCLPSSQPTTNIASTTVAEPMI
jgi:hypothetical protein